MNLDLTSYTFPSGWECFKDKQTLFDEISKYIKAIFDDTGSLFVVGDTIPSIADQDKVWIRVDAVGWPIDILTYTSSGWEGFNHREIGCIKYWAGSILPRPTSEWAWCDGRTLNKYEYADLYAVIGDVFANGDETTDQFSIPDIRSRIIIGTGSGSLLTPRTINDNIGEETNTLVTSEIPGHTHNIGLWLVDNDTPDTCGIAAAIGSYCGTTATTASTGDGDDHENIQPSLSLGVIMRVKAL